MRTEEAMTGGCRRSILSPDNTNYQRKDNPDICPLTGRAQALFGLYGGHLRNRRLERRRIGPDATFFCPAVLPLPVTLPVVRVHPRGAFQVRA